MEKPIVVRLQSPLGTKRVELLPSDTTCDLFEKVFQTFQLNTYEFCIYRNKGRRDEIVSGKVNTVNALGVKHGDTLYIEPLNGVTLTEAGGSDYNDETAMDTLSAPSTAQSSLRASPVHTPVENGSRSFSYPNNAQIVEDDVDQLLLKMDGKIKRQRDPKFCHHGSNASCVHCSPLEPYDETYIREQNIKHMPFHAYLRKLRAGADRGKFMLLEDISCRIKVGCKEHPPWPKGICSKCQPSAITLNRQVYRHVDHVMFENPYLVENFINYWRRTGYQRYGLLYGKYEVHSDVPLGIRAVVAAIYEPPQTNMDDGIEMLEDPKKPMVDRVAEKLGLKCVGWIFTDLVADDVQTGTVKCVRGIESHFLSAQECITAGMFQNQHKNPCKFSSSGYFGSKFVTVCITGDATNQVHMEGYSVSNQCMALERDDILVPTVEASELGYIKESSEQQYVPDVFYKEKDSYGNEIVKLARPLPVEYLLVDVPTSTPVTPQFTFLSEENLQHTFPIENRLHGNQTQDFVKLCHYIVQFGQEKYHEAVYNFHVLLYLATNPTLFHGHAELDPLLDAVNNKNGEGIRQWFGKDAWFMFNSLIEEDNTVINGSSNGQNSDSNAVTQALSGSEVREPYTPAPNGLSSDAEESRMEDEDTDSEIEDPWTCNHCTFFNTSHRIVCDMCQLPRSTQPTPET